MGTAQYLLHLGRSFDAFNMPPTAMVMMFPVRAWVKVFRINPEFRILRLTFHRKSSVISLSIESDLKMLNKGDYNSFSD